MGTDIAVDTNNHLNILDSRCCDHDSLGIDIADPQFDFAELEVEGVVAEVEMGVVCELGEADKHVEVVDVVEIVEVMIPQEVASLVCIHVVT